MYILYMNYPLNTHFQFYFMWYIGSYTYVPTYGECGFCVGLHNSLKVKGYLPFVRFCRCISLIFNGGMVNG